MRNYVIINGVNSLTIQGLAINNLPPITKPMIRTKREEIDGRDGDIVTELGYSAYDKSMEIGLYGNFDIDEIIKYFTGEGTIVFSNEADKYYNFKILDQIDYEKLLKFKTATITFHCQPFKYPVEETPIEGEAITITGSGSNITLENTIVAPMDMKLKGNTIQDGTPTPDSPVPVQVVSGDNSIEVCGKNLFNPNVEINTTFTNSIATALSNFKSTGKYATGYTSNGTSLSNNANYVTTFTPCQSGVTYTINNTYSVAANFSNICFLDNSGNVINRNTGWSNNPYTHTTTSEEKYIMCGVSINDSGVDYRNYVMIEKGSTATTYEEYKGTSYPISLGVENLINDKNPSSTSYCTYDDKTDIYISNSLTGDWKGINIFTTSTPLYIQPGTSIYYYSADIRLVSGTVSGNQGKLNTIRTGTGLTNTTNTTVAMNNPTLTNEFQRYVFKVTYTNSGSTAETTNNYYMQLATGASSAVLEAKNLMISKQNGFYKPYQFTPIELCKIGTYQDKIDKSSGKNLFDKDNADIVTGYIEGTTGNLVLGGTSKATREYIPILPNTNINISGFNNIVLAFYNQDKTFIERVLTGSNSYTFNKNAYYIRIQGTSDAFNADTIMLNEGSTALPYEPYGTDWYLKKEIGKVVLNGSESWYQWGTDTFYITRLSTIRTGLSNYYKYNANVTDASQLSNGEFFIHDNTNNNVVIFRNTSTTSVANFKTWLTTHNTEVYYVLDTPTYTKITDTALISQLEALKPYSYNPVTNITQTNNDAPFELDVSLSYTNTMNVNNVGNIYAKPILTIEGSGTIGIILNGIEVLSVDLGTDEKITIDVPNLQAYDPDDNILLNRNVTGDYMKLLINDGDNTIAFSGSVTSATLTNYTRWI